MRGRAWQVIFVSYRPGLPVIQNAPVAGFHKLYDFLNFRWVLGLSQFFYSHPDVHTGMIENSVRALDGISHIRGHAGTLQPDGIDSDDAGGISIRRGIGRHILYNFCAAGNHGIVPHTTELMDRGHSRNESVIPNVHMTGKNRSVCKYIMIS